MATAGVQAALTADHERAASFLSSVKGERVAVNSPFVYQLVAMLAAARADAFAQAAVRADEDRLRAQGLVPRPRAEVEYLHPQGIYGTAGGR